MLKGSKFRRDPIKIFLRIYALWALAFIRECRCTCSKPEIINLSPQGFSLGIGHTFKTFSTPSVLVCMDLCISYPMCRSIDLNRENGECRLQVKSSVTNPDLLVPTLNIVHMDKENFPKVSIPKTRVIYSCSHKGCTYIVRMNSSGLGYKKNKISMPVLVVRMLPSNRPEKPRCLVEAGIGRYSVPRLRVLVLAKINKAKIQTSTCH